MEKNNKKQMLKRVAFQGEKGAFSERAAFGFFGKNVITFPQRTFKAVFELVESRGCDYGVIPIENSLTGSVHQNYDLLLKFDLTIAGEIKVRIKHHLLALKGAKFEAVKQVHSHPQALEQCADFLEAWKGIEIIPMYDTAGSARFISEQGRKDAAAIASRQAAEDYGLQILRSGIESNHLNYTRFLIMSRNQTIPKRGGKTSIVFSTKDIPGALFKSLSVFALRDINLLKIESRPLHNSPWNYIFYLDFEGSMEEQACRNAINHLMEITTFLKVLGSYPKGREID